MNSLISFDGFADVANNLIDKLSNAAGWVVTHETPTKTAVDTFIKDIQKSNYDPLTKALLISNAKKTIKEYSNQYKIVGEAIKRIASTAQPQNVDSEWLAQFMDKARLVSDEEFQIIWSCILAEECNENGSVPKGLLHVLEQMDKDMAKAFLLVASVTVNYIDDGEQGYHPVIINDKLETYYKNIGITLNDLLDLQSIGLIEMHFGRDGQFGLSFSKPTEINYFEDTYKCEEVDKIIGFGNVVYTRIGTALCKAVSPEKIDGFFETICIPHLKKQEK